MLIFLSHASEDQEIVGELCQKLKADGFDPWLDKERLFPGMDWDLEIEKALRASDVVLLCFSSLSVTKEGYIQREFKRAMRYREEKPDGTIYVIPVRLDDCDLPYFIQEVQWVDYPNGYDRLVISLNMRSGKLSSVPPVAATRNDRKSFPKNASSGINIQARDVKVGGDIVGGSKYVYGSEKNDVESLASAFQRIQREIDRMPENPDTDPSYLKSFVEDIEQEVRNGNRFDEKRLRTSLKFLRQSSEMVYSWVIDLLCSPDVEVDPQLRKLIRP